MNYYLLQHRNPHGDHFRTSRSKPLLAIVVHVTAGLEDVDGGGDSSAEKTAQYAATTDRTVSWHWGSDTDSFIDLLPSSYTAYHCVNYNSSTAGIEISKRHTDWRSMDPEWVTKTLTVAAGGLAVRAKAAGIPFRHCTKAELDRAIATGGPPVGFVGHAELDPARRSDPGLVRGVDTFPWDRLFALMGGAPNPEPPEEDDVTPDFCFDSKGRRWVFGRGTDKAVWAKVDNGDWFSIGGVAKSGVSAKNTKDGIAILVRGDDDAAWTNTHKDTAADNAWAGWASLGGVLT